MAPRGMSLDEIKAEVCWRLKRRGCWGARYMPVDAFVDWLGKLVKDDGKRVRVAIDELVGEGILLSHKKRRTVSLNPHRSREVEALIEEYL
jgi:hypothetical protein